MQDREIVASIVAGEPGGLAAAFDDYAPALHVYCRGLLGEPSDAADAVQDTFIVAAAKLGGLRDSGRLRPWLYAVARNECRRRLRARASAATLDEAGDMADDAGDVGAGVEQRELRDLVRAALGGLNPGDREIIELNLRHELDGADLAAALGVSRNQAHALASRARTQFEASLGTLLVARSGQRSCPDLAAILDGWDGQLTVLLRKRVNRHIESCDVCGERKRHELSPAMLLGMLPVIMLPPGLRQQLLRLVADDSPAAAAYRDQVAQRAEPFGRSGFPGPLDPPHPVRGPGSYALAIGAAVVALMVLGGGSVFAADMLQHHQPRPSAASTPPAGTGTTPLASSPGPVPSTPSASPSTVTTTPAPLASTQPALTPQSPSPHPSPSPSASHAHSSPPPPSSPPPSPGTLTASPAIVRLTQPATGGPWTGTFTLTAQGGPVTFSIKDPAPAGDLQVSPSTGPIDTGKDVTVRVTVVSDAGLTFQTDLTVDPGGLTVTIEYPPKG